MLEVFPLPSLFENNKDKLNILIKFLGVLCSVFDVLWTQRIEREDWGYCNHKNIAFCNIPFVSRKFGNIHLQSKHSDTENTIVKILQKRKHYFLCWIHFLWIQSSASHLFLGSSHSRVSSRHYLCNEIHCQPLRH